MHGSGVVTRSYKEFRLTHSPVKALLLGESIMSRYKSMSILRYVTRGRNTSGRNFSGTCETEDRLLCFDIEVLLCLSYVVSVNRL